MDETTRRGDGGRDGLRDGLRVGTEPSPIEGVLVPFDGADVAQVAALRGRHALGPDAGPFFHGNRADLQPGDLITPGRRSNFGRGDVARFVYLAATMDAAIWGAELAQGDAPGRVYRVEPTGAFEDDPNVTDQRFPGNPTRSYRTRHPLRVAAEIVGWQGHPPEALAAMRASLDRLRAEGVEAINE